MVDPRSLSIERLRCFVAVADSATYEMAADKLGVSQPTVWKNVSQLSETVGFRLFHSGTTKLTQEGGLLLHEARAAVASHEAVLDTARDVAAGRKGRIIVACYPAHIRHCLAALIGDFLRANGDIAFGLAPLIDTEKGSASQSHFDVLAAHAADLAVGPRRKREFDGVYMYTARLVVVLPPDHPERNSKTISVNALRDHGFIVPPKGYFSRVNVEAACEAAGFSPRIVIEDGNWMTLMAFGEAGVGVPIVPDDTIDLKLDQPFPTLLNSDNEPITKETWLQWRHEVPSEALKEFLTFSKVWLTQQAAGDNG